jgi:AraC-like DNA-binding protein
LKKRDIALIPAATRRGTIVYPQASGVHRTIQAYAPSADLQAFVEYFWIVRWDVGGPQVSQTIPQPRIHLTIEGGRVLVYGIDRKQFKRTISGRGAVLGTAFRPAGFRPFVDRPLHTLRDRVVPAASLLRVPFPSPAFAEPTDADLVAYADAMLVSQQPEADPVAVWCQDLVQRAEDDRGITRVRQLAAIAGVSERSLQRRFNDYVGASPKWVIQRSRVMSLVADCNDGATIDWAAAATNLGFADQAHLIRVFREIVGVTPDRYLRRIQEYGERG